MFPYQGQVLDLITLTQDPVDVRGLVLYSHKGNDYHRPLISEQAR